MGKTRLKDMELTYSEITPPHGGMGWVVQVPCIFREIVIATDGTNNITLNLYDNDTMTGRRLCPTNMIVLGTSRTFSYAPVGGLRCLIGVYVQGVLAAGSMVCQVIYDVG